MLAIYSKNVHCVAKSINFYNFINTKIENVDFYWDV